MDSDINPDFVISSSYIRMKLITDFFVWLSALFGQMWNIPEKAKLEDSQLLRSDENVQESVRRRSDDDLNGEVGKKVLQEMQEKRDALRRRMPTVRRYDIVTTMNSHMPTVRRSDIVDTNSYAKDDMATVRRSDITTPKNSTKDNMSTVRRSDIADELDETDMETAPRVLPHRIVPVHVLTPSTPMISLYCANDWVPRISSPNYIQPALIFDTNLNQVVMRKEYSSVKQIILSSKKMGGGIRFADADEAESTRPDISFVDLNIVEGETNILGANRKSRFAKKNLIFTIVPGNTILFRNKNKFYGTLIIGQPELVVTYCRSDLAVFPVSDEARWKSETDVGIVALNGVTARYTSFEIHSAKTNMPLSPALFDLFASCVKKGDKGVGCEPDFNWPSFTIIIGGINLVLTPRMYVSENIGRVELETQEETLIVSAPIFVQLVVQFDNLKGELRICNAN